MVNDLTLQEHSCCEGWASRGNFVFMYISCVATILVLEIEKNNRRLKIDRNEFMHFKAWPKNG